MAKLTEMSSAIQALAAIAMLLVTIALAWFAYRTVELTKRLANISDKQAQISANQLRFSRQLDLQARQRKAAALAEFERRIRISIRHLDPKSLLQSQVQSFNYVSEPDIAAIEALAAEVSSDAASHCGLVSLGLRIIVDQIESLQQNSSWQPSPQHLVDWNSAVTGLPGELAKLEKACDSVLREKPSDA